MAKTRRTIAERVEARIPPERREAFAWRALEVGVLVGCITSRYPHAGTRKGSSTWVDFVDGSALTLRGPECT